MWEAPISSARLVHVGAVVILSASILVACNRADAPGSAVEGFSRDEALEMAAQKGLAPSQVELLERAADVGEVPFADYQSAIEDTLECMRASGHRPFDVEVVEGGGQPVIMYGISASPLVSEHVFDETLAECSFRNSDHLESLYVRNPGAHERSIEEAEALFRAQVSQCLESNGYEISDREGETWLDLTGKVTFEQTDPATLACILDTGFLDVPRTLPIPDGS